MPPAMGNCNATGIALPCCDGEFDNLTWPSLVLDTTSLIHYYLCIDFAALSMIGLVCEGHPPMCQAPTSSTSSIGTTTVSIIMCLYQVKFLKMCSFMYLIYLNGCTFFTRYQQGTTTSTETTSSTTSAETTSATTSSTDLTTVCNLFLLVEHC